jgi:hypothetical protein
MRISQWNEATKAKVHKIIWFVLRYVLPLMALVYLAWSLSRIPREVWQAWLLSLNATKELAWILPALVLLMMLSWGWEAVKWRMLAGKLEPVSFFLAYKGILYGVSMGMITPKRSGEIAGRAMILSPGLRWKGMLINMAGSICQLIVTLVFGLLALWIVLKWFHGRGFSMMPAPDLDAQSVIWLLYALPAMLLLVLVIALFRPLLSWLLGRPNLPVWVASFKLFLEISRKEFSLLMLMSLLRYLVFLLQFYLLLRLFQFPLSFVEASLSLALMYLLMAAVPVSALAEVGLRGAAILLVFDFIFADAAVLAPARDAALTAAVLGLWLINLAIPALAGVALSVSGRLSLKPMIT